jgi:hypothetical protein
VNAAERESPCSAYRGFLFAGVGYVAAVDGLVDAVVVVEKDRSAAQSHFVAENCPDRVPAGELGRLVLDVVGAADDVSGLGRHDSPNAGTAADGVAAAAAVVVEAADDCSIGVVCYARQGQQCRAFGEAY